MENVKVYRLNESIKLKLYSDIKMYKKMFYLMLNNSIDGAEKEIKEGRTVNFSNFIYELNKEFGI